MDTYKDWNGEDLDESFYSKHKKKHKNDPVHKSSNEYEKESELLNTETFSTDKILSDEPEKEEILENIKDNAEESAESADKLEVLKMYFGTSVIKDFQTKSISDEENILVVKTSSLKKKGSQKLSPGIYCLKLNKIIVPESAKLTINTQDRSTVYTLENQFIYFHQDRKTIIAVPLDPSDITVPDTSFVEISIKYSFYDPDFMRYVPDDTVIWGDGEYQAFSKEDSMDIDSSTKLVAIRDYSKKELIFCGTKIDSDQTKEVFGVDALGMNDKNSQMKYCYSVGENNYCVIDGKTNKIIFFLRRKPDDASDLLYLAVNSGTSSKIDVTKFKQDYVFYIYHRIMLYAEYDKTAYLFIPVICMMFLPVAIVLMLSIPFYANYKANKKVTNN